MTVQCQHFVCHQCECASCNTLRDKVERLRNTLIGISCSLTEGYDLRDQGLKQLVDEAIAALDATKEAN